MRKDIGIDLGTDSTMIYLRSKGLVLSEPTCVVVDNDSKGIIAIGNNAREMIGKTPKNITAVEPLKNGVISDFDATEEMLSYFIKKALTKKGVVKPRVIACTPYDASPVEKKAIEEAILQAGAREVIIVDEPMAAAIGIGLPVEEPVASMIVDIGAGTSEASVISLNGIVSSASVRVGGNDFDRFIMQYIKRKYGVYIGEASAEAIKIELCSLSDEVSEESVEVKGRDTVTGLPKSVMVNSVEISECVQPLVERIIDVIKETLENTPPELSADILEKGIVLCGGGCLIKGMCSCLSSKTGMKVFLSENPKEAVVLGTGKLLEEFDFVRRDFGLK